MQWVEIFRMLGNIGYSRNLNFEPRGEPIHFDAIEKTAQAPKRIVALAVVDK